jgi:hypothetical protein
MRIHVTRSRAPLAVAAGRYLTPQPIGSATAPGGGAPSGAALFNLIGTRTNYQYLFVLQLDGYRIELIERPA